MHRRITGIGLGATVIFGGACAPAPAQEPINIGANEHFRAFVNGATDGVVVDTSCPGPTWPGRTGQVVEGQTVEVRQDPFGAGLTDRSGTLFARTASSGDVRQITSYATPTLLDDLEVPCDGSGVIVFDPCFGIIGCIQGGQADSVKVTFVNVAR